MSWLEISVRVPRETAALVESLLLQQQALAVTLSDDADDPVLEPGVGETPLWPSVQVTGLFGADTDRDRLSQICSLVPGLDRPQLISFREVADQDWERAWMDRFSAMRFGQHLWIVPTGLPAPDEDDAVILKLDPGLAFGTGTHPTTALCLDWIDSHDFTDQLVVDYGCGSGVLGIAAALKGATKVMCVDNDPQALQATEENARRNAVEGQIETFSPEDFVGAQANVVLANILAGPLISLAPRLQSCVKPRGKIVLSGLLAHQAEIVNAAYQSALAVTEKEGWILLAGQWSD